MESEAIRRVSWLLTAKCFGQAATPLDWMPRIYPAASLPARYGSSEKYSKLRPHSGLRFILSPGPNTTDTSCAAASSPKAAPISSPSAASQLFATADAVGKQVAGTLGFSPKWSLSPACLRKPWGPSDSQICGMPCSGIPRVLKVSAPESSAHFSSKVNFFSKSSVFCIYFPFS